MRINSNLQSLNVYRNLIRAEKNQSTSMNRINTGIKLNKAADDPNRISQRERFKLGIRSLNSCSRNIQDSVSMLQTIDGGMSGIIDNVQRIRELTLKAGGPITDQDKNEIQKEINSMLDNIDYLAKNTGINGLCILNKNGMENSPDYILTKVDLNDDSLKIPTLQLTTDALGIEKETLDIYTIDGISETIKNIDSAIFKISSSRSKYGSLQNRLESSYDIVEDTIVTLEGANSLISDTDMAEEIMKLTTQNILAEAGNAIMVQTNNLPNEVLSILRNMR